MVKDTTKPKNKKTKKVSKKKSKPIQQKKKYIFEAIGDTLNTKQELFCQYMVKNRATFDNATQSYALAYGYDLDNASRDVIYSEPDASGFKKVLEDSEYNRYMNSCSVMGYNLLRNIKIDTRIKELLREIFTEETIDNELSWLMAQREDPSVKMAAIREVNKLKGRIIDRVKFEDMTPDPEYKDKTNSLLGGFLKRVSKK